jgi:hypothetical protein
VALFYVFFNVIYFYVPSICVSRCHLYISVCIIIMCQHVSSLYICVIVILRLSSSYAAHVRRSHWGAGSGSHSQDIFTENMYMKFEVNIAWILEACYSRKWYSVIGCIIINFDMDMSYTRVLHIKVAYRVPHKWRHAFYVTRPLLCAHKVLCNSYNTRPLVCARITCYVTVITVEINHCSFRRVRFALLYIVTRSKIV